MRSLYARLRGIGLSTPYVRKSLLPEWWEDDAATTPIPLPRRHDVQFKLVQGTDEQSVDLARTLGEQAARYTLLGVEVGSPESGAQGIRGAILETGAPWVSFGSLLDYCWSVGIPVIHLARLPNATKKMDGLAVNIDDRPAIVLASNRKSPYFPCPRPYQVVPLEHNACGGLERRVRELAQTTEDLLAPREYRFSDPAG